jgi:hypothetical protein
LCGAIRQVFVVSERPLFRFGTAYAGYLRILCIDLNFQFSSAVSKREEPPSRLTDLVFEAATVHPERSDLAVKVDKPGMTARTNTGYYGEPSLKP